MIRPSLGTRLRSLAGFHWNNADQIIRRFSTWILLVPILVMCLIVVDSNTQFEWFEEKGMQEIIAPTVLAVSVFVAALYWARAMDFYSRWLLLLSVALFCRELHFWGTNNGIYIAVLLLAWYASRNIQSMQRLLASRLQVSLLVGAFLTYALTKTFDRAYWRFITGWRDWQDTMEESLETTAHLQALALVIASYLDWGQLARLGLVQPAPLASRVKISCALGIAAIAGLLTVNLWHEEEQKPRRSKYNGFPPELSSLCSVSQDLGDNLFLASSDEEHELTVWRLDENNKPQVVQHVDLTVALTDGDSLHLDDIEDIAWDGRQTYYAVSSHRHLLPAEDAARQRKSHGTECALVRFQLVRGDSGFAVSNSTMITQDLLAKIRELGVFPSIDWQKSKTFSWRGMVKTWQLDVEGLAYVDGQLLLGFKDPVEQGKATILSYDLERDQIALAARPDFGGNGILSLHYDSLSDSLFVLSNDPIKHRFADSCLWVGTRSAGTGEWAFSVNHKYVIEPAAMKTRRKASGVTIRNGKIAVCFDSETQSDIKILALEDVLRR